MLKNHGKNSEFLRSEAKSLLGTRVHFAQTLSGDALPPFPCVSAVYLQPLTLYFILEGKRAYTELSVQALHKAHEVKKHRSDLVC